MPPIDARLDEDGFARIELPHDQAVLPTEIRALLPQYRDAPRTQQFSGTDATGAIGIVVNRRGAVVEADVQARWRESLGPQQVASAVFQAYQAALQSYFSIMAMEELARSGRGDDSRLEDFGVTPNVSPPPGLGVYEWSAQTWDKLDANEATLRRATQLAAAPASPPRTVAGPGGCLSARIQGGNVTEIIGNVGAIVRADGRALRREVLAVFALATRQRSH
jgi:hypothetical protein